MLKSNAGAVAPVALLSGQNTSLRSEVADQCEPKPGEAEARPATGDRAPRKRYRQRQESAAFRRNHGQNESDPPVLDDRDVVLTRREAAQYLRRSLATLDRWAAQGRGPRRIKYGPGAVGYRLSDLRKFVAGADVEPEGGAPGQHDTGDPDRPFDDECAF
jgi:predicted DNA-binding transcriptional regulator AlpA